MASGGLGARDWTALTLSPDNVWDIDCTNVLDPKVDGMAIHGEYFNPTEQKCYALMRAVLEGNDRSVLIARGLVPPPIPRQQSDISVG